MTGTAASSARSFLLRLAAPAALILSVAMAARAGGPKYVAGVTDFDSSVTGWPLVWSPGQVTYFTDQGDLSPVLPNPSANSLVATAFAQWTSVSTAALSATSGGQLAEDVNGTNVSRGLNGSLVLPADIQPSATTTPIGIVYDSDGTVTDAFLGAGAGDPSQCFFNAVFGAPDNYGEYATFQHALVVINGQCVQQSSQLADVEYRLVRVMGNVLGLGWSQLNGNVSSGKPAPTADDLAGFPVMHYTDPWSCNPITRCYANPYALAPDDIAAISRLYPINAQNQSSFSGKQIFSSTTGRIHGSVWFTDPSGNPTQPMQGVNVVARWIDPVTGQPSHHYSVSSVSGFLFIGNAGNPMTGYNDPLGDPFNCWGSESSNLEGFFDLAGLPFPTGASSAQYQLSVEAIDPLWSAGVRPYAPNQVLPSGSAAPIVVTVTKGGDEEQNILMTGSAQPVPPWSKSSTWTNPAPVPAGGDWMGSLSGYGAMPYFSLGAQGNRTLSVAVTALDEHEKPSTVKALPMIGMWSAGDPAGTAPPAFTNAPFNAVNIGETRLDVQVNTPGHFLIGIADLRGDGRPDYHYHAHVLYGDSVVPHRVGVNGGAVTINGIGFNSGLNLTMGSTQLTPMALSAGRIVVLLRPQQDGMQTITLFDPATGSSSTMTGAVTVGAAASDSLVLIAKGNPPTPVGTQAAGPVSVQAVASDGVTPVAGATIAWSTTNGVTLSECGGASACSVTSDDSGMAATWVTPTASGTATITATLAPESYISPKSVTTTLSATSSALDIGLVTPYVSVAQGATISIPLTARVLSNGSPQTTATVNFQIMRGSGTLNAASAPTNSSGYAGVTLSLANFSANVQVSACVAPANAPCQSFYLNFAPTSQQNLQTVAGAGQIVATGTALQPMVVRVVDSSSPPNNVLGASVLFQSTIMRPTGDNPAGGSGETNTGNPGMPVILSQAQATSVTDANGLARFQPSTGSLTGALQVDITVSAGTTATLNYVLEVLPGPASLTQAQPVSSKSTSLKMPAFERWNF